MGSVVLAGATSGSTTITPSDTVTVTVTLPSTGGTLQTSGAGFTTNGVAYASSTSALTTGSSLVWTGSSMGVNTSTPVIFSRGYGTVLGVSNTGSSGTAIQINSGTSSYPILELGRNGTRTAIFDSQSTKTEFGNLEAVPLLFITNATEAMRIDSSGNLMVGTTTPSTTALLSLQKSSVSSTYGNGVIQNIFNSGATSTTRGYNSVLRLSSNTSGADCNVVITDNNAYNYYFGGYQGTLYCMGGNTGGVGLSQGGTSWSSLSDATLKNVTGTYSTALSDVAQIEPVKFTWKNDADNKPCVGVIAQSVQKVIPEAVEINQEGLLSVRYTDIIPLLVASIQELSTLITAQSATIQSLTERITALEGART